MKKIFIFMFCISTLSFSDGYYLKGSSKSTKKSSGGYSTINNNKEINFINPMNFNGTDKEKDEVIEFIKVSTKKSLELIGMDSDTLKREMEQQQLNSFKELTKATDKEVMEKCIKNLEMIGTLDYTLLKGTYDQEISAKNKELKW